jgi:L-ascorbate metabolism protein UlaG (beta-lactamase superfamily)
MNRIAPFVIGIAMALPASSAHADMTGAKALLKEINWLGHGTFRITGEKVIYTDPFEIKSKDTSRKADIILITNERRSACSPDDMNKVRKTGTVIIAPAACRARLSGDVRTARPGDVINAGGIRVLVAPACHNDEKARPKANDDAGYVFTVKGQRLYLAGRGDRIPEIKTIGNVNIAFLPVSGDYAMAERKAVRAALAMAPDIAIPTHYGRVMGTRFNAEKFAEDLRGRVEVVVMREK